MGMLNHHRVQKFVEGKTIHSIIDDASNTIFIRMTSGEILQVYVNHLFEVICVPYHADGTVADPECDLSDCPTRFLLSRKKPSKKELTRQWEDHT